MLLSSSLIMDYAKTNIWDPGVELFISSVNNIHRMVSVAVKIVAAIIAAVLSVIIIVVIILVATSGKDTDAGTSFMYLGPK